MRCDNSRGSPFFSESWVRAIYEVSISLNLSVGVALGLILGYDGVFVPFWSMEQTLYYRWGMKGWGGALSGYLAFAVWLGGFTVASFCIIRWLCPSAIRRLVLTHFAGYSAVATAPICWFYLKHRYGWGWSPIEPAVCCLFATLYLFKRWPIPAPVTVGMVVLHYAFWTIRFAEYPHSPVEFLAPMVGFCTCIAWGMCLSALSSARN
jgi:hypothetical protein